MVVILLIIGLVILLIGAVLFFFQAFKVGFLWGLATIFIPFISLVFLIVHWDVAKKPFFIQLVGTAICFVAMMLGAPMTVGQY